MPCATVHLHLADRILARWDERPSAAPFPVHEPRLRDAFLHGSLAPDMGFVPGVDRFVSELAHYSAPAGLGRRLLERAHTPRERAFAWGWIGHVVGDVVLHPLVGRAMGERLHGDRDRRMNAEDDLPTHVGLEVGLDLALLDRVGRISPPPRTPLFRRGDVGAFAAALEDTYGLEWRPDPLYRGHHRAVRLTALWPLAIRAAGADRTDAGARVLPGRLARGALAPARAIGRLLSGSGSPLEGFLRPLEPPPWLVERVLSFGHEFAERMAALVGTGARGLEDRNLETGGPAGPGLGHPPSDAVAEKLFLLRRRDAPAPPRRDDLREPVW